MKIRIGVGAGNTSSTPDALAELVRGLDDLGFDSLWLSEVLTAPVLDPVVGLAWAAANNPRLKLGTTMLLPGRHVLRLAKQLSGLAGAFPTGGCLHCARLKKRPRDGS